MRIWASEQYSIPNNSLAHHLVYQFYKVVLMDLAYLDITRGMSSIRENSSLHPSNAKICSQSN